LRTINEVNAQTRDCPVELPYAAITPRRRKKALPDAGRPATFVAHARFVIETQPRPPACLAHRGWDQRRSGGSAVRRVLRALGRGLHVPVEEPSTASKADIRIATIYSITSSARVGCERQRIGSSSE